MMKRLYKACTPVCLLLIMMVVLSCSVQNKISREYKGRNEGFVKERMGKPVSSVQLPNGKKMEVFEKRTRLRRAPINTGQFQYDRFDSPESTKIETFKFTINPSGIIEKVDYECSYER